VLLFRAALARLILDGLKTQTRRTWDRPRVRAGEVAALYTVPPYFGGVPFGQALIHQVWRQRLADMTEDEVLAEGFATRRAFEGYLRGVKPSADLPEWVIAVRFELVACCLPGLSREPELDFAAGAGDDAGGSGE
jgi:hypothetical protein